MNTPLLNFISKQQARKSQNSLHKIDITAKTQRLPSKENIIIQKDDIKHFNSNFLNYQNIINCRKNKTNSICSFSKLLNSDTQSLNRSHKLGKHSIHLQTMPQTKTSICYSKINFNSNNKSKTNNSNHIINKSDSLGSKQILNSSNIKINITLI